MTLESSWRQTRKAGKASNDSTDLDAGIETVELALVTALVVVIVIAVMPLLDTGITAAFQSVADALLSQGIN